MSLRVSNQRRVSSYEELWRCCDCKTTSTCSAINECLTTRCEFLLVEPFDKTNSFLSTTRRPARPGITFGLRGLGSPEADTSHVEESTQDLPLHKQPLYQLGHPRWALHLWLQTPPSLIRTMTKGLWAFMVLGSSPWPGWICPSRLSAVLPPRVGFDKRSAEWIQKLWLPRLEAEIDVPIVPANDAAFKVKIQQSHSLMQGPTNHRNKGIKAGILRGSRGRAFSF